MNINDKISEIKGIGPKKEKAFNRLKINTIDDLIHFYPRKYEDRRFYTEIAHVKAGKTVQIKAQITKVYRTSSYGSKRPLVLHVADKSGKIEIVFFHAQFIQNSFKEGQVLVFYGKASLNKGKVQIVQPEFYPLPKAELGIIPIYPLTNGLNQKDFRKAQTEVANLYDQYEEWLSEEIIEENKLCSIEYALQNTHFPENEVAYQQARFRLVYEELFTFLLGLRLLRKNEVNTGICLDKIDDKALIDSLPFQLTSGQEKVWQEIKGDLLSNKRMNRLIQGDVGSGKTVIAQLALEAVAKKGYQGVMMVPTEILAKQHFENTAKLMSNLGIRVGLLCGSMKAKDKNETKKRLLNGEIDILIGTHALISEGVEFNNLALVVTDEQHRFGVNQRNLLVNKGEGVNVLLMTATPIPRTLAAVLYSGSEISIIDTMPKGRREIITSAYNKAQRRFAYDKLLEEVKAGHQGYVVCPLIDESEAVKARSVKEIYEELQTKYPMIRTAVLHGELDQVEKDRIMKDFASGMIDVLVSTVVIEVGIDVANATVMIIEGAERFGLAQMHQLRGRVGRSALQSYCLLISNSSNPVSQERLDTMCSCTSGIDIADKDLQLRGPGDFFGTAQHGLPELKVADLARHLDLIKAIKPQIDKLVESDPNLHDHLGIQGKLKSLYGDNYNLIL
ncbi:MAG: ATP-dependent DNA helicase RecG [Clostridia bacterium]|nr:ATP-dependent DNA helicase RecG [Clostridia bacterium]